MTTDCYRMEFNYVLISGIGNTNPIFGLIKIESVSNHTVEIDTQLTHEDLQELLQIPHHFSMSTTQKMKYSRSIKTDSAAEEAAIATITLSGENANIRCVDIIDITDRWNLLSNQYIAQNKNLEHSRVLTVAIRPDGHVAGICVLGECKMTFLTNLADSLALKLPNSLAS